MKSKTVASILRHVASKMPSGNASASIDPAITAEETKKLRRARKEVQEDEGAAHFEEPTIGGANEEEKLEMLYETIAWPLGRTYGHPFDAFKLSLRLVVLITF